MSGFTRGTNALNILNTSRISNLGGGYHLAELFLGVPEIEGCYGISHSLGQPKI